ncbi:MAG: methionyl-tRNA formyltransferase [Actinobacteria bacterium]|nr:methionyl-tRNA formyltransferase [Actinomycetota bacterium]MCL5883282.1 methionyl-tRNA formyltransferase [Actinomycetota bacterium]
MKIAFAGTPKFGALVLGALLDSRHEVVLVFTQPDRPAGRGLALKMSPVKELALREGLRVEQPEKISTPGWVGEMKSLGVKVLTVAAFGQILRAPLLGGLPCINVHASLLPKYRGAAPIERAIMAGERNTGVTIMDITPALDTGPIYLQRVVPITDEDDAGSIYGKLGRAGGEALAEVLDAIEAGGMEPEPQDESAATYVEKITAADMKINFERPAWKIAAQVRALSPHIGAFINIDGLRLKIWKAKVAEGVAGGSAPGAAVGETSATTSATTPGRFTTDGERLFVICGTGLIELLEVQPQGKRRMSAAEFLRGYGKYIQ